MQCRYYLFPFKHPIFVERFFFSLQLMKIPANTVFKYSNALTHVLVLIEITPVCYLWILKLTLTANFVQFLFPMWPAIFFPGQILPGSWKKHCIWYSIELPSSRKAQAASQKSSIYIVNRESLTLLTGY